MSFILYSVDCANADDYTHKKQCHILYCINHAMQDFCLIST